MKITKEEACKFLVRYQGLTDGQYLSGKEGILEFIRKVGCIQYDPLNIIGRNTDLVLQSRITDYRPEMLEQLLYKDRLLIDGWDKMMSVYTREDWPYFRRTRELNGHGAIATLHYRNSADALNHIDKVLESLAQNGPMQPKQIPIGSVEPGRWGHRNLSSATMDYLWTTGKLGVSKKIGVNKVYDLIENLLPADILNQPDPFESEYDFIKWYVYRRIGSVGMLWNRSGGGWLGTLLEDRDTRQRALDELVADGVVERVEVEGIPDVFYARSKDMHLFHSNDSTSEAIRFLAPLDNMLWDRDMLSKLFGFTYTWEVYVPVAKRKYGYYVIPVLCGNRFIARFEPQKSNTHVQIKNWWWEKDISISKDLIEQILKEMERFAACLHKKDGVHESTLAIMNT